MVRGPVERPELHSTRIGSHRDGFVALAADDPLAAQEKVSIQAFQARPFLITERSLAEGVHDRTVAYFAAHGVAPSWRHHRLMGYEQIGPFVAAGYAATLIHCHLDDLELPGVRILSLVERAPRYDVAVVWRKDDHSPLATTLNNWTQGTPTH